MASGPGSPVEIHLTVFSDDRQSVTQITKARTSLPVWSWPTAKVGLARADCRRPTASFQNHRRDGKKRGAN